MRGFTTRRSIIKVKSVAKPSVRSQVLVIISKSTQERNLSNALHVGKPSASNCNKHKRVHSEEKS